MTVLTSSLKPATDAKKESSSGVSLNVTGVDVKGLMFRHPATVLMLDGRDCVFRSDSQPELDGSVLTEFSYEGSNPQSRVSQAHVKSNQADPQGGFKVVVELEFAQSKKVSSNLAPEPTTVQKPAALPAAAPAPPAGSKISTEPKSAKGPITAAALPPELVNAPILAQMPSYAPEPPSFSVPQSAPQEFTSPFKLDEILPPQPSPKRTEALPIRVEDLSPMPGPQEVDLSGIEERLKVAMALEIQREISQIKSTLSSEVEKTLPSIIESKMEKMIREDVEKQIQSNFEASLQTLRSDVLREMESRLAENSELRAKLEDTGKRFFEEQAAQFRAASSKAEEENSTRTAMIMKSFEESLEGLEAKVSASRGETEQATSAMQNMKRDISEGMVFVQDALQQLRNAEKPSIEKMQAQAEAQLKEWAAQFDNLLNTSASEKAIQFSLEMERRMVPHRQRADETIEKLGAMLQLLQGTARVQQERLNEQTFAAAANIEKQIKAFLVRLGEGV